MGKTASGKSRQDHGDTSDDSISLAITGSGGAGVLSAGGMLLEAATRAGWYGILTRAVGPQIRGGESAALLRLADHPVAGPGDVFHLMIAVDWRNVDRFAAEIPLAPESLVIADPAAGEVPDLVVSSGARVVELPLAELAESVPSGRVNMVAMGVAARLLGIPEEGIASVIGEYLSSKGEKAIAASIAAVAAGRAAAADLDGPPVPVPSQTSGDGRWLITGNEAAGLGAVRGGVRFVAAYPITPATEILEWLAPSLTKVGGHLVQAEDELASINMIIGASYGGTPALTATSGPGLALMTESIGLATAAEVPIVVIDVMRGGPSTGIPTKSEQSDLNIAVYGLHGDAPHVVVAPLSVADCLFTTQWAVHLAEAMQCPALMLSDQFLGQARAAIDRPADVAFIARREVVDTVVEGYQRYAVTASGVSPMTLPGTPGGQYTADGLEHSERGIPSGSESDHSAQLDKRRDKVEGFDYGVHWAEFEGEGDLAVITWGSPTAPVREALRRLEREGTEVRLVALRLLLPARPEDMAKALAGVTRILVVEQTHSGQFHKFLRAHYDLPGEVRSYHRAGPLPIRPGEIHRTLSEWSRS